MPKFNLFNRNSNQHQERSRWWLSAFAVFGVLGTSLPPAEVASTVRVPTLDSSLSASTVGLIDFGGLLRGTIRYIQVANISNQEEVAIGEQINEMLLERNYDLYRNPQVNRYVEQIGQRLVAASDRRDIPYNFQIVVSEDINAFAIPGGYIYVTTGLLRAADNEAQLAAVLAHEIAHVNERHSIEALRESVLAQGIAETVGIETSTLAQVGYQLALELPRTRSFEYEADQVGLGILQNAGYAPIAQINFFNQLMEQPFPPEFLRTHPTSENRIEAIAQQLEEAELYAGGGLDESVYQSNISPLL